jgi:signal transduction histidine kinase
MYSNLRWVRQALLCHALCVALWSGLCTGAMAQTLAPGVPTVGAATSTSAAAPLSTHASTPTAPSAPYHTAPIIIDQAQALLTIQAPSELNFVALPYHWDSMHSGQAGEGSFEVAFELPGEPTEPYAVLIPHIGNRADIWLNGSLLSRLGDLTVSHTGQSTSAGSSNHVHAPRYYTIAPQVLQKTNLIRIQLRADANRRAGLSSVTVGLQSSIAAQYEVQYFWQMTLQQMVALVLLLVAVFSASLALTQPALHRLFALTATSCLLWALHIYAPLVEAAWFNDIVSPQAMAATGWLAVACTAYMLHRMFGARQRWALCLGAALLVFIAYQLWTQDSSAYWKDARWVALATALLALVIVVQVVHLFRAASAQAHGLLHTLEQRVADKEAELSASYQKLELLAREQARSTERTRILRDMHDGVGSHISAAIRQLQSGQASNGQVLTTLRDSLDQLKLSIDSMHLVPGDVTALLANMRYRLEPRFTSSGMAFDWDVDLLPSIERLDHSAMRQLQYMVFEALSNVLQHAQARTLRIEARSEDAVGAPGMASTLAVLRVIDDGRGFDAQAPTSRGLASMRERALAIGAQLVLHSAPGRTVVEIRL